MKKIIQKITGVVALSASLLINFPAFAKTSFSQGKEDNWHIGLIMWEKFSFKTIMKRYAMGREFCIGPCVEYKPLDNIGIQTGLLYGYNDLATAGFNTENEVVDGWSGQLKSRESNTSNNNTELIDVDRVQFRSLNILFSIRWYPGAKRQFLLHVGPRLVIPLFKAKQSSYGFMSSEKNSEYRLSTCFNKLIEFLDGKTAKKMNNRLKIKPHFTWDFGFTYNTKWGLIIGMNNIGFELGYDFTKLLVKA